VSARGALYAALMQGGPHSPDRSEKASSLIGAFRAEVLREAADAINALPQDYECDPGRGDSAELLRRMADAAEAGEG